MTGTPDDVQIAAAQLAALDSDVPLSDRCRRFSKAFWAAREHAEALTRALINEGWTPPNNEGKEIESAYNGADLQAAHDAGYQEAQQEAQFHIEQAYLRGQRDANGPCTLTHATPGLDAVTTSPENWTPVPLRWRHVRPGDVFVADERAWMVLAVKEGKSWWLTNVASGDAQYNAVEVDPDEVVSVLCPAPEANALARVRDELGGSVIDRNV